MSVSEQPQGQNLDAPLVFSGVRWLAAGQVATQATRFVVSIVLARLLAPAEFGLLAMATAITTVGSLFSTMGASPVIVQRRELSESLLRSLALLGMLTGFFLSAVMGLGAWAFAGFFHEPRLAGILTALGATFALGGVSLVPDALLQRALRFDRLVTIDLLQVVAGSAISIVLALAGWGAWGLVVGNLAGTALRSAALVILSPWRIRFGFDGSAVRGVVGYSGSVLGFNLVQYWARYTDRLLVGRILGAASLGFYDYAFRFYMYPLEVVTHVLIRVLLPAFSKLQHDLEQLGRAYLRANGAIAFICFPMMAGLAVVADPFVPVVLGEQWQPIVPLIRILAPVALLSALGVSTGQIFLACGRADLRFAWCLVYTALIIAAVVVGVQWGIHGVAVALAIVLVPINIASYWLALRLVNLGLGVLWRTVRTTAALTTAMAIVVSIKRVALDAVGAPEELTLFVCVAGGIACYVAGARRFPPRALRDLFELLPDGLRRQPRVTWLFGTATTP